MKLSQLLDQDAVLVDLKVSDKNDLLEKLSGALASRVEEKKIPVILEAVREREEVMSTGVGKGLAIPHAKIDGIDENHAVFARLRDPLEYGSIDDEPVELVFLLVGGKERASVHIKLLSKISRLMNNDTFRNRLLQADDKDEILELFSQEEILPV